MDAIKTFHTGVSEDFLLKEPQLSGLRNRLLESALHFYRKLQAQLQEADEPGSVAALADAYAGIARILYQFGSIRNALETLGLVHRPPRAPGRRAGTPLRVMMPRSPPCSWTSAA